VAGAMVLVAADATGAIVLVAGAMVLVAAGSAGAGLLVAGVCVELSALVTGVRALVAPAVSEVVAGVCVVAAVLTAGTDAAADVAGAELLAEAAELLGLGSMPESVAAVVACAADVTVEVAADVAVEVADVTAEVSVLVIGDAAGLEVVAVAGGVAACACRENISKTNRIPAASIATCATRRAARRKTSCGMSSSPQRESGPNTCAHHRPTETSASTIFSIFTLLEPLRTEHLRHIPP